MKKTTTNYQLLNKILVFVFLFLILSNVGAVNYYVATNGLAGNNGTAIGTPKATIQSIFDTYNLGSGDIIYVAAGTYTEKGIAIGSDDEGFTIQGAALLNGIPTSIFDSDNSTVWMGISHTNNDNITIDKITIKDYQRGMNINTDGVDGLTISNCFFDNCDSPASSDGGGISFYTSATATSFSIIGTTFTNCDAQKNGGAIAISGGQTYSEINATISKCKFYTNSITSNYNGYAIYAGGGTNSDITITNSQFYGNTSVSTNGHGTIYTSAGTTLTMKNSSVYGNTYGGSGGAGLYTAGPANIYNSILYNNTAKDFNDVGSSVTSTLINCDYGVVNADTKTNCITSNPLVTSNTDLRLQSTSPCINAGTTTNSPPIDDFNSVNRNTIPDIGCYEYSCGSSFNGTYTVGTNGTWKTLTAALLDIRTCMTGNIILELDETYQTEEESEIYPLNFDRLLTSSDMTLTIRPKSTVTSLITIGGSSTTTIFDFNGTDYVTIDGRPEGSGSNKYITIENTSTATGGSAILFQNGATNNNLQYLNLTSSFPSATVGVVTFSGTTTTVGNNSNTIDNCIIDGNAGTNASPSSGVARNGVYSGGNATYPNSTNTISNSEFKNVFITNATIDSKMIALDANNSGWSISNNSFYQTSPRQSTVSAVTSPAQVTSFYCIQILGGVSYNISGNYLGGSSSNCSGTWTHNVGNTIAFYGISLNATVGGLVSTIKSNTIKGYNVTANGTSETWKGIEVNSGNVVIGGDLSSDGNIIGSTSGTSDIIFNVQNTAGPNIIAVNVNSSNSITIKNNIISSIQILGTVDWGVQFFGISTSGTASYLISYNTLGSSTFRSISTNTPTTKGSMIGINNSGTGSVEIKNNNIGSFFQNGGYFIGISDNATATSDHIISSNTIGFSSVPIEIPSTTTNNSYGINIGGTGSYTVSYNIIQNIDLSGNSYKKLAGIRLASTGTFNVSNNTIDKLYFSFTGGSNLQNEVIGIFIDEVISTSSIIEKNSFTNFKNLNSYQPVIYGILSYDKAARLNVYNNFFHCDNEGNTNTVRIFGIYFHKASATLYALHNTIYIGGETINSSNESGSYGIYVGNAGALHIKNNIIINDRIDNGSTKTQNAIYSQSYTNVTNNYYFNRDQTVGSGTGTSCIYDQYSVSNTSPSINPDGSLPLASVAKVLTGSDQSGTVSTDKFGNSRSTTPTKGCYESGITSVFYSNNQTGSVINANSTSNWYTTRSGNSGSNPGNFSTAGALYIIQPGANYQLQGSDFPASTTANIVIESGGALDLNAQTFTTLPAKIKINGTGITATSGALRNSSSSITCSVPIELESNATITSTGSGGLTLSGSITNGGYTLTLDGSNSTTLSGVISGTGGLTKNGSGALTISGNNTFTGGVTLSVGTLNVNNDFALGTGTLSIAASTILDALTSAKSISNAMTVNGSFTFTGTQNLTVSGNVSLASSPTITVTNNNANLSLSGVISNGGTVTAVPLTTAGNSFWTSPNGVHSATVYCFGGGGGTSYTSSGCRSGGAGGSLAYKTITISPNTAYKYTIGTGGSGGTSGSTSGQNGGSTYFGNSSDGNSSGASVLAIGGNGTSSNQQTITLASTSGNIGTSFSGGNGGAASGSAGGGGGGGGAGSGGSGGDGVNATSSGSGAAGSAGSGTYAGGAGGAGGNNAGSAPGGGAGGRCATGNGAAGGSGKLVIEYFATLRSLTKDGAGSLTLGGANTFSGGLIITQGNVVAAAANAIPVASTGYGVTLNGGTLSSGASVGYSQGVVSSSNMGSITLSNSSNVALGTGSHNLYFSAGSFTSAKTLTISGWTGTGGASGTGGKIFCGNSSSGLTADQLLQISFTISGSPTAAMMLSTGEIVPVACSSPTIIDQPPSTSAQNICSGGSFTQISITATGTSVTYQWYSNTTASNSSGTLLSSETNSTYTPSAASTGTLYYYCIATACSTPVTSDVSAAMVVNADPTIDNQPSAVTECIGGTDAVSVSASGGTPSLTYQWYSNTLNNNSSGSPISLANSSSYTVPSSTAGTTYYYVVVSASGSGCTAATSSAVAGTINAQPSITTHPSDAIITVGSTYSPSVSATDGVSLSYQWKYSADNSSYADVANSTPTNASYATATTNTMTLSGSVASGTYYYKCYVTSTGSGCNAILSNTGILTINSGTTTFYYNGNTPMSSTSNWGTNVDGTGTNPSSLTADNLTLHILDNSTITPENDQTWAMGNGTKLIIGNGTNQTNFTIKFGISQGSIDVKNNATLTIESGSPNIDSLYTGSKIIYKGNASQSIPTSSVFDTLEINNSNSVNLIGNTTINGKLNLTNGKLNIPANTTLTLGTPTSNLTLSGGSSTSYIATASETALIKRFVNTNTNYIFPMGEGNNYTPMTLNFSNGATIGAYITSYVKNTVAPGFVATNFKNYINRYWSVSPSASILSGTPNYTITYTYVDSDINTNGDESKLIPVKVSNGTWYKPSTFTNTNAAPNITNGQSEGSGGVDVGTNTLTWSGLSTFSFDMAAGDEAQALPIHLLYFTAKPQTNRVRLDWATASETNNDYFTVERSQDGEHFNELFKKPGAGISTTNLYYFGYDNKPFDGISYYRLKQTDFDGKYEYSDVESVNFTQGNSKEDIELNIYPNPVENNTIHVKFDAKQQADFHVAIYDAVGKLIYQETINAEKGPNDHAIELPSVAAGMYQLEVKNDNVGVITKSIEF